MRRAAGILLAGALVLGGCGKDPKRILEEADAAREMGLHKAALTRYLELREAEPETYAYLDERIGDTYSSMGETKQALAFWEIALKRDPKNAVLWNKRGAFLIASGDAAQGKAALQQALALDPKIAQAHLQLGILEHQAGNVAAAMGHLGKAAELQPDDANTQKAYGVALVQSGQTGPGALALHRAWKKDRKAIGTPRLFELLYLTRNWAEAAEVGKVAATDSGDPLHMLRYAYALVGSGQVQKGVGIMRTLQKLDLPAPVRKELEQLLGRLKGAGS